MLFIYSHPFGNKNISGLKGIIGKTIAGQAKQQVNIVNKAYKFQETTRNDLGIIL